MKFREPQWKSEEKNSGGMAECRFAKEKQDTGKQSREWQRLWYATKEKRNGTELISMQRHARD